VMDDMVGHPTPPRALRDSGVLLTAYASCRRRPAFRTNLRYTRSPRKFSSNQGCVPDDALALFDGEFGGRGGWDGNGARGRGARMKMAGGGASG
jgi:hypothetical protein